MKLLDLFCGAGGASEGYARAGFEVTGIDVKHGKRYPHTYIRGDVRDYLNVEFLSQFDVIAAIPPAYTHYIGQQLSTEVIHRGYNNADTPKINAVA